MRAAVLAALMVVAVSVSITTNALESSCAIPAETLSFECSSDCEANEACMLTSNSSVHTNATETVSFSSLTSCPLACFAATSGFNATPSGTTRTFTLLVPFGTWKSDMELLNQPATASEHTGELLGNETLNATFASISNDFLKKIDPLKLPFNTTSVSIRGGSKILEPSTKSRVANVELAENFLLKNDTNVTELTLVNLNLNTSINKLANTFPAILTKLVLSNNLLTEFPAPVTKLKKLTSLFLDNNFITNVPSSARMKGLLSLVLNHNNITKYNGVFETASYLDLSYNQLTKAPYTIARHTQLQTLNLAGNYIPSYTIVNAVGSIQTLNLTDTKLKTYSAHLLSLERLYITGNNLTTIPTVMFRHTRLKELYLDNNKFMKDVALSTKQARFIFNLKNFTIDEAALKTNCSTESQLKLHNYTFCLTDGPVTPQATQQNTPMPTPKAKPAKPTPKPKGATKLKELKKRMVSVRVGIKSSPSTTSTGVPPPVDTVETSVVSTTDAAPVLTRVESTTLASQRSNSNGDSGENDPVALAVTGVSGGVAVALAVMGSIWIGGKAAKRLKQTATSTRGAKKPIQQQPQQLVIEDEDEAGEVDAGVAV